MSPCTRQKNKPTYKIQVRKTYSKRKNISKDEIRTLIKKRFGEKQKIKNKIKLKHDQLYKLVGKQNFQCPICLQLMIHPVITICGHSYCFKCLEQMILTTSHCAVCRGQFIFPEIIPNLLVQSLINDLLQNQSQQKQEYETRMNQFNSWWLNRQIDPLNLKQGDRIDVKNKKDFKWCQAIILSICQNKLQIAIQCHPKEIQLIDLSSTRIANYNFYTKKKSAFCIFTTNQLELSDLSQFIDPIRFLEDNAFISDQLNHFRTNQLFMPWDESNRSDDIFH